ncbi:Methyltransferase-like protein 24 [Nowakowskiella sp. JEL0407]|nr:Methyltransferase-like protein 24 [Nowakowskiella sp. JEL0407]
MLQHPATILRNPVVLILPVLIIVVLLTIDLQDLNAKEKVLEGETNIHSFAVESVKTTQESTFARLYSVLQNIQYNCLDNRPIGGAEGKDGVWQVHSFDPTMTMNETQRSPKSFFHPIGIGAQNDDNFGGGDKFSIGVKGRNWTIRTLDAMKETYRSTTIPILKIDTEYNEWEVLEQWLDAGSLANVDQLLMEVHFWPQKEDPKLFNQPHRRIGIINKWATMLEKLRLQGFKLYNVHRNPLSTMVDLGIGTLY